MDLGGGLFIPWPGIITIVVVIALMVFAAPRR
jgi:hypothetical protein